MKPSLALSLLASACLAAVSPCSFASASGVVISQVYGGGGNSGATLKNDFIELFNAGSAPVALNGWSVQYASSTGSSWQVTPLPGIALQPGQYLLVQEAMGAGGTTSLPAPDATGTIALSASSGKVALVSSTTALSGALPSGASLVDLVGFGTANGFEGGGAVPALTNTTAALRNDSGCTDSDSNAADFAAAAPAPRNSSAALHSCGGGVGVNASIMQIQGSGSASPLAGQAVTTRGVVTRVNNNGYFLQDPVGDGNAATSDGLFVFTGTAPTVVAGQLVEVKGKVVEFNTGAAGNADTLVHTVTELSNVTAQSVLGSGYSIAPTPVTLPEAVNDELERYEGMLVTIQTPLTVSQNYFLGRYGQLTLSAEGRMETPTNRYRAGSAEAIAMAAANARRRIVLDDGTGLQNPNPIPYIGADNTVRAGDTVDHLTGVVDYGLATSSSAGAGDYKLHPTVAPVFTRANPRSTQPPLVGGNVRVASFNVLNFFTTLNDGSNTCPPSNTADDCRGANSAAEFTRQRDKIVAAMAALNADAIGLMEMQNNGSTAVQNLVDALNARVGAGTYAVVPTPAGGAGSDAIKVAMIYKPATLSRVGSALSDTNPVHNRPPLAQTFAAANGERFSLIVNHFKSKGSCDSATGGNVDSGDGQGCWNALRLQQGQALRSFVATVQAQAGDSDVVLVGDFNAYAKEDPIVAFTDAGWVDQIGRFNDSGANFGYSYVFDGAAGRLDHALATPSLSAQVTGAVEWHINADEPLVIDYNTEFKPQDLYTPTPYRSSDHDPVVMGLSLVRRISGDGRGTLGGTPGDDIITGGSGAQTISGGTGRDVFVYTSLRDGGDVITDFAPGTDRLDLSALLATLGVAVNQAMPGGYVRLIDTGAGVSVQIDADGSAGAAAPRALVTLAGLKVSMLVPSRDLGL